MENNRLQWVFPLKMVMFFHSYVNLPEGKCKSLWQTCLVDMATAWPTVLVENLMFPLNMVITRVNSTLFPDKSKYRIGEYMYIYPINHPIKKKTYCWLHSYTSYTHVYIYIYMYTYIYIYVYVYVYIYTLYIYIIIYIYVLIHYIGENLPYSDTWGSNFVPLLITLLARAGPCTGLWKTKRLWIMFRTGNQLVGGFNPSEKYESQLGLLFLYGQIKFMFQTTNQPWVFPVVPHLLLALYV